MASACVNHIGISPDSFLDSQSTKFSSYAWLSPRKSFTGAQKDSDVSNGKHVPEDKNQEKMVETDPENDTNGFGDFEFCLEEDNFTMLPADELFFDGKLVPLHLSMVKPPAVSTTEPQRRRETSTNPLSRNEISIMDPYLFSPKAPRCTTRWKELLGLKKLHQKEKENNPKSNPSSLPSKSLKNLLNRSSKSSISSSDCSGSINLPLLKDSDNEYISISSSRLSLSSTSSSHEHDDLPRLSLDTEAKHSSNSLPLPRVSVGNHQRGARRSTSSATGSVRSSTRKQQEANQAALGISMDSPRMNASGKIIFQSLERSTSSPSSYGGPRYKHSSVQRSYSANVRVTPVLNVPVCSKTGSVFGLFGSSSSQPKRDSFGSINGSSCSKGGHHNQSVRQRKDRN